MRCRFSSAGIIAVITALVWLVGCSTTPQQREASHLQRGNRYFKDKNYRSAVIEFKVASQNMPKDTEPLYQLGMVYTSAGAGTLAIETFQKVLATDAHHLGARYQLALYSLSSNKPEILAQALPPMLEWSKSHPDDADAVASLGLAQAKLGNKAETVRLLEKAAAQDVATLRVATAVIAIYFAKGDEEAARQVALDLSSKLPKSPEAAILRGQVSLATNNVADADAQISRALSLKRDFRPALQLRLRRELMMGDAGSAEQTTQELARLPEKRMWGAYGRILFSENKIDQAIAEYQRALREHKDDIQLRDDFASMLMAAGRGKEAESVVAGTLSKSPRDVPALLLRTTLEIDNGNLDAAAKDVKTQQDMQAFSPQLTFQAARILGAGGDTVREGDLLADALRRDPRLLGARLELARILVRSGKARIALETLDQAAPSQKTTGEYVYYRNMALIAAGDWEQARRNVDSALAVVRSPGFLYQDALLRVRNRDLPGARKSLEAAFQLAPSDTQTLNLLSNVMRQQAEFPKFVEMIKEAAAKNKGSAVLQYTAGNLLVQEGDTAGARAAFEAAKTDGDVVNPDIDIAILDLRAGALDQARVRLLNLIKTHDSARARMSLAEIEARRGSTEAPVQHYLKAIQLEPANVLAMNNLADFLATRQKKYDDAIFWAQKALALSPENPYFEDTIGWAYYLEGKYDLALPFLEKSVKALDRPLAHYHLAAELLSAGDPARARQEYNLGLKADPKSPERSMVETLFASGKRSTGNTALQR